MIQKIIRNYLILIYCSLVIFYFIKNITNDPINSQNETINSVLENKEQ